MIKLKSLFVVLILLIFSLTSIHAKNSKDTLQISLQIEFSGRRISGRFNQLVVGGGIGLDVIYGNWHLENKTNYRYNKTNSTLIEDNWYDLATLKYYINGRKKFYPGIFYYYDNSLIYRVNRRQQYGIGIGSTFDKGSTKLDLIAAFGYENTNYNGSEFVNSERDIPKRQNGIFLFRANFGYGFASNKISISSQLFYFQSLKEGTDFDLWINPKISFKIWKAISIYIAYDYRFENVYLETLSNYNDILLFGLNLKIVD